MSDFLGRAGRITEWVVISNLENRAVNAACDKAQDWWKNRKHKKDHPHDAPPNATSPPPPPVQPPAKYPDPPPQYPPAQYPPQQGYYMPPPPPMGNGQLIISVNQIDGLTQWGPLLVVIECNYQRYTIPFSQFHQQFTFPVHQVDYDQVLFWIQTEYQQQTVAHGEIPVRILLNDNNSQWPAQQQQQRWIPLRDNYNGPAGQLFVSAEYRTNYSSTPTMSQAPPPPPPYPYYS